jgi:hypothetical protein
MDRIAPGKAIEILDLNQKEGKPRMPRDVHTSIMLSLDVLAWLLLERAKYGYDRIPKLPHEGEFTTLPATRIN